MSILPISCAAIPAASNSSKIGSGPSLSFFGSADYANWAASPLVTAADHKRYARACPRDASLPLRQIPTIHPPPRATRTWTAITPYSAANSFILDVGVSHKCRVHRTPRIYGRKFRRQSSLRSARNVIAAHPPSFLQIAAAEREIYCRGVCTDSRSQQSAGTMRSVLLCLPLRKPALIQIRDREFHLAGRVT